MSITRCLVLITVALVGVISADAAPAPQPVTQMPGTCIYNGMDYSGLDTGNDITYFDGATNYTYLVRACSQLSNGYCFYRNTENMICILDTDEHRSNWPYTYSIGSWPDAPITWQPLDGSLDAGITQIIDQGNPCAFDPARTMYAIINYMCVPGNIPTRIVNVINDSPCRYIIQLESSNACPPTLTK